MTLARRFDVRWWWLMVIACVLGFSGPQALSQDPGSALRESWRWRWFSVEAGLPSATIDKIIETPAGELWVLTRAGMAWYNGNYWQSPPDDAQPSSFQGASATADSSGVYLVTRSRLYHVDHAGYHPLPLRAGPSEVSARHVVPLRGRGLLIQGDSCLYLLRNGALEHFPSPFDDPVARRVPEATYGVLASRTGYPILNAPGGVYRWNGARWDLFFPLPGEFLTLIGFSDDRAGNGTFCGRIGRSLYRIEWSTDGTLTRTPLTPSGTTLTSDCDERGTVLSLEQSGNATLRQRGIWSALDPLPPELIGATTIWFDARGDLWVGKTNGLHVCRLSSRLWTRLLASGNGLLNTVNAMLFTRDSALWVGTSDGILVYRGHAKVRMIQSIGKQQLGIITALAQDRAGHVWVASGSSFSGAYRWDGSTWKHFGAAEGFSDNGVHRITRDREGRLWFLTISFFSPGLYPDRENGAFIYDGKRFERMDRRNGLPDGRVYAVVEDSAGTLWFATGRGIGRLRDNVWTYWTTEQGLRTNKVFTLALEKSGRLWFGHQTQGLGSLDGTDAPKYVTPEEGFSSPGVWDLLVDHAGRLWVATREGLAVHDRGVWATIGLRDGLPNPNLWPLLMRDSVLHVGMTNAGVAGLDLRQLEGPAPAVRFHEPVDRGDLLTLMWQAYGRTGNLFERDIPTRYRLDDGDWSPWGLERPLELRNLSSGDHTITVQARGPLAQVDPAGTTLKFTVPPPFYFRPSFFVPVGVLTGLLLLLGSLSIHRKAQHSRELRERDARLRAVLDQQSELIVRVLPDGTLSFVNGAVSRTLRTAPERLIGRRFPAAFAVTSPDEVVTALWKGQGGGAACEQDVSFIAPDGSERWVRWVSGAIVDGQGVIHEYQMIGRDITDTKIAEHDLLRSEERYRITAEATGQLVYDLDLRTGVISWQGAIQAVTGFTPEEFSAVDSQRWWGLVHPDDRAKTEDTYRATVSGGAPFLAEFRLRRKNGEYIDISGNGILLMTQANAPERMLGTLTNISARKQVEMQIAASLKEKEVLLKEIHHRVKNNLQVISSLLSLQSGATTDTHAREQLRESQNRIRSMAFIHERLYQSENLAHVNFGEYVRSLVAFLFRSYNVPNIHVIYSIDQCNLPVNTAIPCGLVINELVSNALKYAFKDRTGGEIEIGFSLLEGKRGVLMVRDDGVGFPHDLDFRATQTLGMQLVNTLTAQIDGSLGLIRDRGTTFTITMPLED
ncbi:MAG: PAS domain S-box protein [Ignavibacteriae bacterium]|nr:PAS domain S-box protein [Ignavibacteriota bacterium]